MNQLFKKNKILDLKKVDLNEKDEITDNPNNSISIRTLKQEFVIQIDDRKQNSKILSNQTNPKDNLNKIEQIWVKKFFLDHSMTSKQVKQIFCDTNFETADVLIVLGIIQMVLGTCVIFIQIIFIDEQMVR